MDKRGRLMRSAVLDTPMLFRNKREATHWMQGSREMLPAPEGTKAVRVTINS